MPISAGALYLSLTEQASPAPTPPTGTNCRRTAKYLSGTTPLTPRCTICLTSPDAAIWGRSFGLMPMKSCKTAITPPHFISKIPPSAAPSHTLSDSPGTLTSSATTTPPSRAIWWTRTARASSPGSLTGPRTRSLLLPRSAALSYPGSLSTTTAATPFSSSAPTGTHGPTASSGAPCSAPRTTTSAMSPGTPILSRRGCSKTARLMVAGRLVQP